jgi:hypothetical protein
MADISRALQKAGTPRATVPVRISYRIIHLFSAGLYSSPNKAAEELVANSYDALAQYVHVVVPDDLHAEDSVIWIVDNGTGMDEAGLMGLWQIATSQKRDPERESKERPPIGRFGIGKLASYVLANQLTHITKVDGVYRAVTMDFHEVEKDKTAEQQTLGLPMRQLTEIEAKTLLAPLLAKMGTAGAVLRLFGKDASATWTVAAMSDFKPLAFSMRLGLLKRVLATALPMSPQFQLFVNGSRLRSPKESVPSLQMWTLGKEDKVADKQGIEVAADPLGVEIPGLGRISGFTEIYADPLTGGKAEKWGHSNGIFVTVRGRVINLHDPLFGLPALSHGPFSRFRMVLAADGLDDVLRATREAVITTPGVLALREYIQAKFNEARLFYIDWLRDQEDATRLSTRVGQTPQSLSRRPLVNAIRSVLEGKIPGLTLTDVPRFVNPDDREALINRLEAEIDSEQGVIQEIKLASIGVEKGLAVFHPTDGTVYVNALHPFYANYAEHFSNSEPFELLAVAEVLTEGYLIEEGLDIELVQRILHRRDRFLRELVYSQRLAAPLVAEMLKDSVSSKKELEDAVGRALSTLGLEVSPMGGNGKPDGIALATIGVRDSHAGRGDYSIAYDAKSTGKPTVKAKDLNISGVARHRLNENATFSLIVAPGFEGEEDPDGAANVDARSHHITLMTVKDLVNLVLVASTQRLAFLELRNLFETCRTPGETRAWIESAKTKPPAEWPIPEILNAIWDLQRDTTLREPVQLAAVRMQTPRMKRFAAYELQEWMTSVKMFAPQYVTLDGDVVYLEVSPDRIIREVRGHFQKLPVEYRPASVVRELKQAADSEEPTLTESKPKARMPIDRKADKGR